MLQKGYRGTSQAITTSFLVPQNSINYWKARLKNNDVCFQGPKPRFYNDEQVITFYDPDGLELELVAHSSSKEMTKDFGKMVQSPMKTVYEDSILSHYLKKDMNELQKF